jgi:hypothetical protein
LKIEWILDLINNKKHEIHTKSFPSIDNPKNTESRKREAKVLGEKRKCFIVDTGTESDRERHNNAFACGIKIEKHPKCR